MTKDYNKDIILLKNIQTNLKLLSHGAKIHLLYGLQDMLDPTVEVSVSKIIDCVNETSDLLKLVLESKMIDSRP